MLFCLGVGNFVPAFSYVDDVALDDDEADHNDGDDEDDDDDHDDDDGDDDVWLMMSDV